MDNSSSVNPLDKSFDHPANNLAKLKRLKIQEVQLINTLNKSYSQECHENLKHCLSKSSKLKKNLIEINNLFQEIKENSCPQVNMKESDVNDIKKDVLNMVKQMKSLKKAIETELNSIKSSELILTEKVNEEFLMLAKKRSKTVFKLYNDIVHSPVKALMNSPAKAKEIQDFQDFVASNGRYGGWLEYNHNIFVKVWQKYFHTETQYTDNIIKSASFSKFAQELFEKVTGLTYDELQDHSKWYLKFINLKHLHQKAIDSWKQKRLIKKGYLGNENAMSGPEKDIHRELDTTNKHGLKSSVNKSQGYSTSVDSLDCSLRTKIHAENKKSHKSSNKLKFNENALTRVTRPTEQWNNRCFGILNRSTSDDGKTNIDVENLGKLCIPQWRSFLLNDEDSVHN